MTSMTGLGHYIELLATLRLQDGLQIAALDFDNRSLHFRQQQASESLRPS